MACGRRNQNQVLKVKDALKDHALARLLIGIDKRGIDCYLNNSLLACHLQVLADLHMRDTKLVGNLLLVTALGIVFDRNLEQLLVGNHSLTPPASLLIKKSCETVKRIMAGMAMMTLVAIRPPQLMNSPLNVESPTVSV